MLVRRDGGEWREPEVTAYPREADLQRMIAQSPSLLPGAEGPVVVAREFRCEFGSIDIVGVDLSGHIIVCECKTAENPELRRKVVGQIFAYAAALWGLPWETFARRFEESSGTSLVDQAHALAFANEAGKDDWDEETFRRETAKCLDAGEFRLVLAVEAIPDELRKTVRFLNVHSTSGLDVLALELSYRRDGEVEILVPRTWGEETAKGARNVLDREKLLAVIGEASPAGKVAEAVLEWAEGKEQLRVHYSANNAHIETRGAHQRLLRVSKKGNIRVWIKTLRNHGQPWDQEGIEQLVQDFATIGVELDLSSDQPKVPVESLADGAQRRDFFNLMEAVLYTLTDAA